MKISFRVLPLLILIFLSCYTMAQHNYSEDMVPDYQLPNILLSNIGKTIATPDDWLTVRRPEILQLFKENMFGLMDDKGFIVHFEEEKVIYDAINDLAILKEVSIIVNRKDRQVKISLLLLLPNNREHPVPLFLGLNFFGNHTIHEEKNISIHQNWVADNPSLNVVNNTATEASRGVRSHRWPIEKILERGYGIAAIYYGDLDPDFDDGFNNGLHSLLSNDSKPENLHSSISAWAYGLSKAMDYFETDPMIAQEKIAVIGHSRLGKAALWAGALDQRIALIISNNSGCGGAALSKRSFGETVNDINTRFPHWFVPAFHHFNQREEDLLFDQHMLISLLAPRPVYVASAKEDQWADPHGEYLSIFHASEAYRLFGFQGFQSMDLPEINSPQISGPMGYHIRSGKHDLTEWDWQQYLNFADQHFKK